MLSRFRVLSSYLLAGVLCSMSGAAAGADGVQALVGGRLIDGYGGRPVENAVVLVKGEKILDVGTQDSLRVPKDADVVDTNGKTILPGLWESHGHLEHIGEGDPATFPEAFSDRKQQIMAAAARTNLMAGITAFRDTGGSLEEQLKLRRAIEAGDIPGPRLYLAGPILRQSHAKSGQRESPYHVATAKEARAIVSGIIETGADQIKVYGNWDVDLLRVVVATAHAGGVGVDADVRHPSAYKTALEAGVDRLHHVFTADPLSSYSDAELRRLVRGAVVAASGPMANIIRGPYIIPTVAMREAYVRVFRYPELLDSPDFAQQYPEDIYRHLKSSWGQPEAIPWGQGAARRVEIAKHKVRQFIEAGGREQLVAGTDAGSPFNFHSALVRELRILSDLGLTPMEVIQSATLKAAQMQGVADQLGTVTPGKYADLIVVDGDPLSDISVLAHRITHVMKGGRFYKQPER